MTENLPDQNVTQSTTLGKKFIMEITVLDNKYDPETTAMLQAFYSRNHKPIKVRLEELGDNPESVKKNLEKWYVGYGHKSIGQCGAFTIFIENVSILAAKAIQDSQLYNGQETSTRYIDFAVQEIYAPFENTVQKRWIDFYVKAQKPTLQYVAGTYGLDLTDPIQEKTAKARVFDILRGFLPAGCKTQLSWFTSFTHAADRLVQLRYHPLVEVQEIAQAIIDECKVRFPFAFSGIDKDLERFGEYYSQYSLDLNYMAYDEVWTDHFETYVNKESDFFNYESAWDPYNYSDRTFHEESPDVMNRPKGAMIPRWTSYNGRFQFQYMLDYGSYRDIQRHRNCINLMPVLVPHWGFHDWYVESLPKGLRDEADYLIGEQMEELFRLSETHTDAELQYLCALGFRLPCVLDCDLPQLVYLSELRTSKTVHPTLRQVAMKMADIVKKFVPIYDDTSVDEIDLRRGTQDIIQK